MTRLENPQFTENAPLYLEVFGKNLDGARRMARLIMPLVQAYSMTEHEVVWGILRGFTAAKTQLTLVNIWGLMSTHTRDSVMSGVINALVGDAEMRLDFEDRVNDPNGDTADVFAERVMTNMVYSTCLVFPDHPFSRKILFNASDRVN